MSDTQGRVTRDADMPVEIGHLFQAFNRCCDGYSADAVLQASANMVVAAINYIERGSPGGCKEGALALAGELGGRLPSLVASQWDREASPADVVVPLSGN
jgi:hypothetical protein